MRAKLTEQKYHQHDKSTRKKGKQPSSKQAEAEDLCMAKALPGTRDLTEERIIKMKTEKHKQLQT